MGAEIARSGRALGPKGQSTRQRLLDSLRLELESGARALRVTRIARSAGTSPATFYQYFDDVGAALRELAAEASAAPRPVSEALASSWHGARGFEQARELVRGYLDHWDRHRSVLGARNAAAQTGDADMAEVRRAADAELCEALERKLRERRSRGALPPGVLPGVAAVGLVGLLERVALSADQLCDAGTSREALIETCARLVHDAVSGR